MFTTMQKSFLAVTVMAASAFLAFAAPPAGWLLAGSKPANYETGVDQNAEFNGLPSGYLLAKSDSDGFGTLMQQFSATQYLGKRVRLSAWVKSENVTQWAGLWMRVDPTSGNAPLAFDNMQSRPIKGTTAWQQYQVVLDVSDKAKDVAFGILLAGPGEVWMNSTNLEVVPDTTPTTGGQLIPEGPANLSFEK